MDVFVNSFMEEEYSLFTGMIPGIEEEAIDMGGFPFEEMGPLKYVKGITAPVFYIQAENDKWTDVEYVKEMYEESPDPKELLLLEGDMHRFDTYNYFGDHPEQLLTFIDKYL
jgi:pimeloyl-ACP methyl ester carboxylesterase